MSQSKHSKHDQDRVGWRVVSGVWESTLYTTCKEVRATAYAEKASLSYTGAGEAREPHLYIVRLRFASPQRTKVKTKLPPQSTRRGPRAPLPRSTRLSREVALAELQVAICALEHLLSRALDDEPHVLQATAATNGKAEGEARRVRGRE